MLASVLQKEAIRCQHIGARRPQAQGPGEARFCSSMLAITLKLSGKRHALRCGFLNPHSALVCVRVQHSMTGQAQDMARRRMHKIIMGSWDGCDGASAHFYRAATTWPATRTRQSTVLPMRLEASHAASAPGIESRELLDCFCQTVD